MLITRKSVFTGNTHSMELPITEKQIKDYMSGTLLQNAFPNLTPAQRDFIKLGCTEEEWEQFIGFANADADE